MILLAIETATGAAAAAVATDDGVVAEMTVRTKRRHVEVLHPAIAHVCEAAGIALSDVGAVAVDVGPGLFTGIRVGVAAAKAIAMGLGVPAVAVTSLDALAYAAREAAPATAVVPVVDLRRGEVAWSIDGAVGLGPPGRLVESLTRRQADGIVFAGDGALLYKDVIESSDRPEWRVAGQLLSSAPVASVAGAARLALASGDALDAALLAPCYLREADAKINWTTRHDSPRGGE